MNEWHARMLLRGSMLSGSVLSAISLAYEAHWLTIGGWQFLAMAVGFAVTSLCSWLPYRWLRKRQFAF